MPRTISGRISYTGRVAPPHQVVVAAQREGEAGPPAQAAVVSALGPYTISNVADGTYRILAFIDTGRDMGSAQPDEPIGWYDPNGDGKPDPVVVSGGKAVTGIDIVLRDPK